MYIPNKILSDLECRCRCLNRATLLVLLTLNPRRTSQSGSHDRLRPIFVLKCVLRQVLLKRGNNVISPPIIGHRQFDHVVNASVNEMHARHLMSGRKSRSSLYATLKTFVLPDFLEDTLVSGPGTNSYIVKLPPEICTLYHYRKAHKTPYTTDRAIPRKEPQ